MTCETFGISSPRAAASVQTKTPPCCWKSTRFSARSSGEMPRWYRTHLILAPVKILATASAASTVFANTIVRIMLGTGSVLVLNPLVTAFMRVSTCVSILTSIHFCSNLKHTRFRKIKTKWKYMTQVTVTYFVFGTWDFDDGDNSR